MKNVSLLQNIYSFIFRSKPVAVFVFSMLSAILFLPFSNVNAQAPHISYASPQVYNVNVAVSPLSPTNTGGAVPFPTIEHITGGNPGDNTIVVAVDASGNIYYANQLRDVIEIPSGGNQPIVIANGVTVHGLAVDAAGNVYFSQGSVNIQKIAATNRAITTVASGLKQPTGIAIDAAGNLYFSEAGGGDVKKIPAGSSAPVLVANGFGAPNGIAVDGSGNVFVADRDSNTVKEILSGSSTVITLSAGSASSDVFDVAVDVFGNVYFVSLGNTIVTEIPVGGGSNTIVGSGFYNTQCIAVDHGGDIFVGNLAQPNGGTVGGQLQEIPAGGYTISPLPPAGISLDTRTGVISGTPMFISSASNYIVTATNSVGSGYAGISIMVNAQAPNISYASPQVYKTNVAISPLPPTNTGGAVPFPTIQQITGGHPGDNTIVVAVDTSGNIYYANQAREIIEIPANGNQPVVIVNNVTVNGLAVDATGDVYFSQGTAIRKITAGSGTITNLATGQKHPTGIALDLAGDVYFSEGAGDDVKKIPVGSTKPVVVATGFNSPVGIATDRSGNVYVADIGNNAVKEILAGSNTVITLYTGSSGSNVYGVVVDVFGNVYFVNLDGTVVTEIPVGGGSNMVVGSGFYSTQCIAMGPRGDIFVGNFAQPNNGTGGGQLQKIPAGGYKISPLPPAGLSLNTRTGVISGTPTVASPATNYTVTATNSSGSGTATVNIKVLQGSNKSLSHLTLSNGTLSPAFATATTSYTAAVAGTIGSVSLTPTTTNSMATVTVNGTTVASGSASPNIPLFVGPNTINVVVDSATTETTYTVTVTRAPSPQADLSQFKISRGTLTPAFSSTTTSYTASVANGVSSITVTPNAAYTGATIKVNGVVVTSGSPSGAIPLSVGQNTINTVVTTSDGTVTKTYTLVVTEAASTNANLTSLKISKGTLSPAYNVNTTSYTASEPNTVSSITVTPTAVVSGSTIKVNGTAVTSGSASQSIPLFPGTNTITTVVTAQDGSTTKTYTIVVTEAASADANLSSFKASRGVLSPVFNPNTTSYSASVVNGATSTIITPTAAANGATIKVNGTTVASGSPSGAITLNVGANTITTVVTASDGTTTKTYTFTITRAGSPANIPDEALSVSQPAVSPPIDNDGIIVHQGISPNGDGINDYLVIDGILAYPDNKVSVINRNGQLVFEAKGYDNASKVFDGHSNKTGQMQLPGTYFYSLEYTVKGIVKHKTGYLVLKY